MELDKPEDNFSSLQIRCPETQQRTPDKIVADKIQTIVRNQKENPAKLLQLVAVELSKNVATNDILMSVGPKHTLEQIEKEEGYPLPKRNAGAAAIYLTHNEHIMRTKIEEAEDKKRKAA